MTFLDAKYTPWPQLFLEYANGGSLDSYPATSTLGEVQYTCQLLSALAYLHTHEPPIVHRDIKPENILCFVSPNGSIRVKFADFGLAKHASYLKTFCGSLKYAAPEIYAKVDSRNDERYTAAVDTWSLGLVFAERECGFPEYLESHKKSTTAWNKAVLEYFWAQPKGYSELTLFLLNAMLLIEPQERKPACYCHERALQLSGKLSRRQAPARPVGSPDKSLIAELGYRNSSLINSILNSTDDGHGEDETFRHSDASMHGTQQPQTVEKTVKRSVATILNGELWDIEQVRSPNHGCAAPTIETQVHQDDAGPKGSDLSTRIRHFLGGAIVDDENRGAWVSEDDASRGLLYPAHKRPRLGNSSSTICPARPSSSIV